MRSRSPERLCREARVLVLGLSLANFTSASGGAIKDGAVALVLPTGHPQTGQADFVGTLPGSEADAVVRSGWYYRVHGLDTREHPFPPPDREFWAEGALQLEWDDMDGKGFMVRQHFSVVDGERPSGSYTSELMLLNLTAEDLVVTVIHYLDASADGLGTSDRGGSDRGALTASGAPGSDLRYQGLSQPRHWMVRARPELESLLADDTPTELTDDGLPFGPGDWAAAYQWDLSLMPLGGTSYWHSYAGVRVSSRVAARVKGDLLGDGFPDLLLWQAGPTLRFWNMRRTDRVAEGALFGDTLQPVAFDDFTGGPGSELLLLDESTRRLHVRALFGGTEPLVGTPPLPSSWHVAGTADFNGDDSTDLLLFDEASRRIVVWTLKGTEWSGALATSPAQAPAGAWAPVGAPDLDGNGHPDLLWHNPVSGKLAFWLMDGHLARLGGAFTRPAGAEAPNWVPVAVGDFGRGPGGIWGSADVVWRNRDTGRLVVWHMDRSGSRTAGVFTNPDGAETLGWRVVGPR